MKILIFLMLFLGSLWAQNGVENAGGAENAVAQDSPQESQDSAQDSPAIIQAIEKHIKERFLEAYAPYNLLINDLSVNPANKIALKNPAIEKIIFDNRLLARDSGSFEVVLTQKERRVKAFFNFTINATIEALTATNSIKTSEVISAANTAKTRIPIAKNMQLPASEAVLEQFAAKSFIANGSVIIPAKIAPRMIVQKGDVVQVGFVEGNIRVVFSASALEGGAAGQTIRAQNTQSGKIVNIEILDAKSARLK